ncbi:MAG: sigma-70 family RNA polymerase sigma factor [Phycisphaerae bacterium]|nr:sigma-70 family RNA polymerase sigma factor [Phycisphaerae bacterium]
MSTGPSDTPRSGGAPNSATTIELLKRLQSADAESAWIAFDARYRPIALAVARRLGLGHLDAEDASQQAMLEFFNEWRSDGYRPERARLRTWLVSIVRHRAIDILRKRDRERGIGGDTQIAEHVSPDELDRAWEEACRKAILAEAMGRLRDDTRTEPRTLEAFERFALQGVPVESVANDLDIEVAEIYRIKSRLIRRLREIVDDVERTWTETAARMREA